MSNMNNGRKPLSAKTSAKSPLINIDDIFGNAFALDPNLEKVLRSKNVAWRFVSVSKLQQMGGYHERGWTPVTRAQLKEWGYDTIDTSFLFGGSPDNLFRRGDSVLAVRPAELHEKHKAYLRQQAQRGREVQSRQAEELRQHVKATGLNATIHEGYGDEE
jgi:hypothetical protein